MHDGAIASAEDNELPFKPQNDHGFPGFIYTHHRQLIRGFEIKTQFTRPAIIYLLYNIGFPGVFKIIRSIYIVIMLTARQSISGDERPLYRILISLYIIIVSQW